MFPTELTGKRDLGVGQFSTPSPVAPVAGRAEGPQVSVLHLQDPGLAWYLPLAENRPNVHVPGAGRLWAGPFPSPKLYQPGRSE